MNFAYGQHLYLITLSKLLKKVMCLTRLLVCLKIGIKKLILKKVELIQAMVLSQKIKEDNL